MKGTGVPDARVLILKDLDEQGWHFATTTTSAKGRQIADIPATWPGPPDPLRTSSSAADIARPTARPSRTVIAEESSVCQRCGHPLPQEFVLLAAPSGSIQWPMLHLSAADDFAGVELVTGEINFRAVREAIPIMVADLGVTDEDLAEDQVTAEQILDH